MSTRHLVLTATPGSAVLTRDHIDAAGRAVPNLKSPRWLAEGDAWEAEIADEPGSARAASDVRSAVANALDGLPIDINVVPVGRGGRRKALLSADMESTIIAQEMLDEMADLVGCRAEIASVTEAAMRGELDFEASLRRRVSLFAGVESSRLDALKARISLMPGADVLIRTLKAHGAKTALVTGGFTIFAEPVGAQLGFDAVAANVLDIDGGVLTGRVIPPIVDPDGKARTLESLAQSFGVDLSDTLAVGDGANDAAMLSKSGLGIAFRAKPILVNHALALPQGAVIRHGDLTALLHLQGYTREEFAE